VFYNTTKEKKAWIVLGLLAGFIGSKIVNKTGEGAILDIILGIVGAVVGGWLFNTGLRGEWPKPLPPLGCSVGAVVYFVRIPRLPSWGRVKRGYRANSHGLAAGLTQKS
jgi:uncharacterized membrane protein YeaQ/YmgE (transglycosylase-associated protein family)